MAFKITSIVLAVFAHVSFAIPLEPHLDYALSDNRIAGGVPAEKGFAPHMVALVFGHSIISLTCGGSIVSTRHILSAAHCIIPFVTSNGELLDTLGAVVGSNKWNSVQNLMRFSSHINHPQWDSTFIKNDVGVLILSEELETSDKISVIALKYDWVDGGVESYVTGWGRVSTWGPIADDLQLLHVRTITGQECIDGVHQASQQWGWAPPVHPSVEICTFHSVDHGMCNGDSGSALVAKHSGEQIGIVSWGFACARGAPDMFGRISGFKNFLKPILKGHV